MHRPSLQITLGQGAVELQDQQLSKAKPSTQGNQQLVQALLQPEQDQQHKEAVVAYRSCGDGLVKDAAVRHALLLRLDAALRLCDAAITFKSTSCGTQVGQDTARRDCRLQNSVLLYNLIHTRTWAIAKRSLNPNYVFSRTFCVLPASVFLF